MLLGPADGHNGAVQRRRGVAVLSPLGPHFVQNGMLPLGAEHRHARLPLELGHLGGAAHAPQEQRQQLPRRWRLSLPGALRAGPRIPLLPQAIVPFFALSVLFPTHYNSPLSASSSSTATQAAASTAAAARGTMHGSWRPWMDQRGVLACFQVDGVLLLGDGGRGLKGRPEHQGHAIGDAPLNAPGVVGAGFHLAPFIVVEGVVVLTAPAAGAVKARSQTQCPSWRGCQSTGRRSRFPPRRTWDCPPPQAGR